MSKHTIVLEFDGGEPSYSASMELLGGRIVAVAFADELERCERIESERDDLLEALVYARRFLNERDHDTAYIDAAIAKARGEA